MSEENKTVELKEEELEKVSGGDDPYQGYAPSNFGNFQVGDRVYVNGYLGHYENYYGTVVGFDVKIEFTNPGITAPIPMFFVLVQFDSRWGTQGLLPQTLHKC